MIPTMKWVFKVVFRRYAPDMKKKKKTLPIVVKIQVILNTSDTISQGVALPREHDITNSMENWSNLESIKTRVQTIHNKHGI